MSLRVSTLLLSAPLVLASFGCATPSASTSPTSATTTPLTGVAATPDAETVILRERVARLERRLADVDGKIAVLLMRAEGAHSTVSAPRGVVTGPRYAAIELGGSRADQYTPEVADGLRSTDLGSRGGYVDEHADGNDHRSDDLALQDIPLQDNGSVVDDSSGGSVSLRMRRDDSGAVEMIGDAGGSDPLAALSSAKDLYAWGQQRLKEKRYLEAIAAFEDVVGRFGSHDLADNSQYWIGVCHQARRDHRLAIAAWQKLPARFPRSPKIPDALFGMAQSHEATGEPALAEVLYDEIVASYPKAEKLSDARKALSRLRPTR